MEETELQNELASIRNLMERSSKFISLSGLSGILAGGYALIGGGVVWSILKADPVLEDIRSEAKAPVSGLFYGGDGFAGVYTSLIIKLLLIAIFVLLASVVTALTLSKRQAKRKNQPMWGAVSRQLMFNMAVPLLTGEIPIGILLVHHHY